MAAKFASPGRADIEPARRAGAKPGTAAWTAAARYAPAAAAAAVMTYLGLWGLARSSAMGNDETVSHWAASLSLPQLAHLLVRVDAVHGLYYLLLHAWLAAGRSPAAIRVPSVLAMIAATALLVELARQLTGSAWAGLFAGLIMALTPFVSYYAQTARSYALVFACVVGETLALVCALRAEKEGAPGARARHRWQAYGALVTLSAYLNEMALLVLAAHAVTVLLARPGRRATGHWVTTCVISTALVAPLLVLSVFQHGAVSWIPPASARQVWLLYHVYFGTKRAAPLTLTACALAVVLPPAGRRRRHGPGPAGAGRGLPWWHSGEVSLQAVAVPLLLIPAALLLVESHVGPPLYQFRYVLYGEAAVALLAGAGAYQAGRWLASAARRPELVVIPGIAVCSCTLLLQTRAQHQVRSPLARAYNFGGPSFYLGRHARRGDGVMFVNSFFRKAELGYPREFAKTTDFALAVPPAAAASYRGIDKPFRDVRPLMLGYRRIWVIGDRPYRPLRPAVDREESQLLLQHFTKVTVRGYRGVWLTLWVKSP